MKSWENAVDVLWSIRNALRTWEKTAATIPKRQHRSIQTESYFGDIKENENFWKLYYRSSEKVSKRVHVVCNRSESDEKSSVFKRENQEI